MLSGETLVSAGGIVSVRAACVDLREQVDWRSVRIALLLALILGFGLASAGCLDTTGGSEGAAPDNSTADNSTDDTGGDSTDSGTDGSDGTDGVDTNTTDPGDGNDSNDTTDTSDGQDDSADIDPYSVTITTYEKEVAPDQLLEEASFNLFNEDGERVGTGFALNENITYDQLRPGQNYTFKVNRTFGNKWPPVTTTFDPGEVDELNVTVGYELKGADSHRRLYHSDNINYGNPTDWVGYYVEDEAGYRFKNASTIARLRSDAPDYDITYYNNATNTTYENLGGGRLEPVEEQLDPDSPSTLMARYGADDYYWFAEYVDGIDRTFIEETTINQSLVAQELAKDLDDVEELAPNDSVARANDYMSDIGTVHKYSIEQDFPYYEYQHIYVDPETGYVVRYEARFEDINEEGDYYVDVFDHGEVASIPTGDIRSTITLLRPLRPH